MNIQLHFITRFGTACNKNWKMGPADNEIARIDCVLSTYLIPYMIVCVCITLNRNSRLVKARHTEKRVESRLISVLRQWGCFVILFMSLKHQHTFLLCKLLTQSISCFHSNHIMNVERKGNVCA